MLDLFNSKYNCRICRTKLRYKADQIIHSQLKHKKGITTIQCPYCNEKTKTYCHLTLHLNKVHLKEKPYGCAICKKKFLTFIQLRRHFKQFHMDQIEATTNHIVDLNNNSIESSESDTSQHHLSMSSSNLGDFLQTIEYTNSQIIPSSMKENFFEISSLKNRNSEKKSQKITVITHLNCQMCNDCGETFKCDAEYLLHIWLEHLTVNNMMENNVCWICDNNRSSSNTCNFNDNTSLLSHLKSKHTWEEYSLYKCDICCSLDLNDDDNNNTIPVNFTEFNQIKQHFIINHLKESSFQTEFNYLFKCECCEAMFTSHDEIVNHFLNSQMCNLNYSGKKALAIYRCHQCSCIFTKQNSLNCHLKQHEYIKNWENNIKNENQSDNESEYDDGESINYDYINEINNNNNSDETDSNMIPNFFNNNNNDDGQVKKVEKRQITSIFNMKKDTNRKRMNILNKSQQEQPFKVPLPLSSFNNNNNNNNINNSNNILLSLVKILSMQNNNNNNSSLLINNNKKNDIANNNFKNQDFDIKNDNQDQSSNEILKNLHLFYQQITNNNNNNNNNMTSAPTSSKMASNTTSNNISNVNKLNNSLTKFRSIRSKPIYESQQSTGFSVPQQTPPPSSSSSLKNVNKHSSNSSDSIDSSVSTKCEMCGYIFNNVQEMVEHRQMHASSNAKKPFRCHFCMLTFSKTDQLTRHMIVHEAKELDSVCNICFSTFSRKQDLDRHMQFHTK
jgi:hypothetical protein